MKFENNKRVREAYQRYLESKYETLNDCYVRPSCEKDSIYRFWLKKILNEYGFVPMASLKIIGFNSMQFSLGFTFQHDGNTVFCYITKDKVSYMLID